MSLTEKYRPVKWEDIIGQEDTVKYLKNLVRDIRANPEQLSRSLLIFGPFGAAKTSLALLFSKSLLCDNPDSNGNPCNKCNGCAEVAKTSKAFGFMMNDCSHGIDFDEITALFNDRLRDKHICVFDEAQCLSSQQSNGLLKLIEDSPDGWIHIFLTTDPDKILPALKSRCVPLATHLLSKDESIHLLKKVCDSEIKDGNTRYSYKDKDYALNLIACKAMGHPRDIIKHLEQVYDYAGELSIDGAIKMLNTVPPEWVRQLILQMIDTGTCDFKIVDNITESPITKFKILKDFVIFMNFKIRGIDNINSEFNYFLPVQIDELVNLMNGKCYNAMEAWGKFVDFVEVLTVKSDIDFHNALEKIAKFVSSGFGVGNSAVCDPAPLQKTNPRKRKIVRK